MEPTPSGPSGYDLPGQSMYVGTVLNTDQDEEEEQAEDERQFRQEMEDILLNDFSDLEESETHQSSFYTQPTTSRSDEVMQRNDVGSDRLVLFDNEAHHSQEQLPYNQQHGEHLAENIVDDNEYHCQRANDGGSNQMYDGDDYQGNNNLSDRTSSSPWSEGSPSLVSSNYNNIPKDNLNPPGVRLNLQDNYDSSIAPNDHRQPVHNRHNADVLEIQHSVQGADVSDVQDNYTAAPSQQDRLKLLYEARGREIDKLAADVERLRAEKIESSSSLKHEITLLKAEKNQLEMSRSQSQILLNEKDIQIKELTSEIDNISSQFAESKTNLTKIRVKVESSESMIKSLEQNICDLQSADSMAKSHKMHQDFLSKLQGSHQAEIDNLRSKLTNVNLRYQEEEHRVSEVRAELALSREKHDLIVHDKSKIIRNLQAELAVLQQQNTVLLAKVEAPGNDDVALENESLKKEKKRLLQELELAKKALAIRKDDLENYNTILKLNLFSHATIDDSMAALNLKLPRALSYDDTIANNSGELSSEKPISSSERNNKLQEEIFRRMYAEKRQNDELIERNALIQRLQHQLKSRNVDIGEQSATNTQLKSDYVRIQEELVGIRGKHHTALEESALLKSELTTARQQMTVLCGPSEELTRFIEQTRASATDTDVKAAVERLAQAMSVARTLQQDHYKRLQEQHLLAIKDRHLCRDNINAVIASLDSALTQLKQDSPRPSDEVTISLKDCLAELKNYTSQIRNDYDKGLVESAVINDNLETLKMTVQKLEHVSKQKTIEIETLHQKLSEENLKSGPLLAESLEKRKENYLKFHDEALAKIRNDHALVRSKLERNIEDLNHELSSVKTSYLAVCKEKNSLEKQLNAALSELHNSHINASQIRMAESALRKEYDEQIRALSVKQPTESKGVQATFIDLHPLSEKPKGSLEEMVHVLGQYLTSINSILTAEGTTDAKVGYDKNMIDVLERLESYREKFRKIENQCDNVLGSTNSGRENNHLLQEKDSSDSNDTLMIARTGPNEYKKLVESLKQDKVRIRAAFEERLQCMQDEVDILAQANRDIVAESMQMKQMHERTDDQIKHIEILRLSNAVTSLHKQIEILGFDHERVVQKLSDEIQSLESARQDVADSRESDKICFQQRIEKASVELTIVKEEIAKLKQQITTVTEEFSVKRAKYIGKYLRLVGKFNKLKTSKDEAIAHYKSEVVRLISESQRKRKLTLRSFSDWLDKSRALFTEGINLSLKLLELQPGQTSLSAQLLVEPVNNLRSLAQALQNFNMTSELLEKVKNSPQSGESKTTQPGQIMDNQPTQSKDTKPDHTSN